ncbi:unnamed protein product [Trifolium pratense]|uniref:Uncharacterized protein n=1 Tax=Trifolium pratense TaxID=57577 RepID=A0ACB0IIU2_TRIPR|nr:unnamed protein product [Trifolium pratense]
MTPTNIVMTPTLLSIIVLSNVISVSFVCFCNIIPLVLQQPYRTCFFNLKLVNDALTEQSFPCICQLRQGVSICIICFAFTSLSHIIIKSVDHTT